MANMTADEASRWQARLNDSFSALQRVKPARVRDVVTTIEAARIMMRQAENDVATVRECVAALAYPVSNVRRAEEKARALTEALQTRIAVLERAAERQRIRDEEQAAREARAIRAQARAELEAARAARRAERQQRAAQREAARAARATAQRQVEPKTPRRGPGGLNNPQGPAPQRWMARIGEGLIVAIGDDDEQRASVVEIARDGWISLRLDDGRIMRMAVAAPVAPPPRRKRKTNAAVTAAPPR
jgi:septal ring factor EnvC (AmiA/AmiB activator)